MTEVATSGAASTLVTWPDDVEGVIGGDITAALAYVTRPGALW